jgi:hypothetical protein
MNPSIFLILNLALGFYNAGTIWAVEIDIFRSWRLVGTDFHAVQQAHWKLLPYWIFTPVALAFIGSIALIWYHPAGSPTWTAWGVFLCQAFSNVLSAVFWGRWQAKLSQDPLGSQSPYLAKILRTHWIRTLLINANALILLVWVLQLIELKGR